MEENGGRRRPGGGGERGDAGGSPGAQERGRREKERRKRGRTSVQVSACRTNQTGVTESHCLLWRNWWIHDATWLDCQSHQSGRHDSMTPEQMAQLRHASPVGTYVVPHHQSTT
jgi:hypothetical protein